jgi:diadenylate cyclase
MDNFDIIVLNLYLLSIFSIIIKIKVKPSFYRLFEFLNIALFGFLIYIVFSENVSTIDIVVKGVPLSALMLVVTQSELMIIIKKLGFGKSSMFVNTLEDKIKIELVKSIDHLSTKKIGAIITLEKNSSLEEFIDSAFEINAPLGNELLSTIFYPKTPLHDGGVIIRKNKILCAGAFYPSSDKVDIPKSLGSRHRAAIGISEISDSLTIVISEQTGNVSIAYNGYLDTDINKQALLRYLERHLQN